MNNLKLFLTLISLFIVASAFCQKHIPFTSKNGKMGYMNRQQQIVVTPKFDKVEFFDTSSCLAVVNLKGKSGYILPDFRELMDFYKSILFAYDVTLDKHFDTPKHLYMLMSKDSLCYYNSKTHKYFMCENGIENSSTTCPKVGYFGQHYSAFLGYYKVFFNDKKSINYIDENFKLLFPKDYTDLNFITPNTLFMKNSKELFGIIDIKGKKLIPDVMKEMIVLEKKKLIKVLTVSGNMGIVTFDGRKIVDTLYKNVFVISDNHFLAFDGQKTYYLDSTGKKLFKFNTYCEKGFQFNDYLTSISEDSIFILNTKGKVLFSTKGNIPNLFLKEEESDFAALNDSKLLPISYYDKNYKLVNIVLDKQLKPYTIDNQYSNLSMTKGNFLIANNVSNKKFGLIDEKGTIILPFDYMNITERENFYWCKQDQNIDLINMNAKKIIPGLNFDIQLKVDEDSKDTILWVKKSLETPYIAYTLSNNPLNKSRFVLEKNSSYFSLSNISSSKAYYDKIQWQNGQVTNKNVSEEYEMNSIIQKGVEKYFFISKKDRKDIRDTSLNSIVPNGYTVSNSGFSRGYLYVLGKEHNGIIDLDGTWIFKDKKGTKNFKELIVNPDNFIILSKEHSNLENNSIFIKLNDSTLDTFSFRNLSSSNWSVYDKKSFFLTRVIKEDLRYKYPERDIEHKFLCALYSPNGKELTNFKYKYAIDINKDSFIVCDVDQNTNLEKSLMIDSRGKIIQDFGGAYCQNLFYNQNNFIALKNELYGVMDLSGKVNIPIIYKDLKKLASNLDNKFLLAISNKEIINEHRQKVVIKLSKPIDQYSFEYIGDYLSVVNNNSMNDLYHFEFYDKNYKLISSVNSTSRFIEGRIHNQLIKIENGNSWFYFDIKNGTKYQEK